MESRSKRTTPVPKNVNLLLNHKHRPAAATNHGSATVSSGPSSNRPCREHSFLTDVADVRQMEQGLLQLLEDFHSGKLQAFGSDSTFEKMDQVREQQERLARTHFELDIAQEHTKHTDSNEEREVASKNLDHLMGSLHELCQSIQNLQKGEQPAPPTN